MSVETDHHLGMEEGETKAEKSLKDRKLGWRTTLSLAFQCLGVVYGDLGTSPLYVISSTFTNGIGNKEDILGALSLIIYTIVSLPLIKYVFIVLYANDNGCGGALALYSLLCRHVKLSLIPNQQPEDKELSNYKLETPSNKVKRAQKLKHKLENSYFARVMLLLITILGTTMVIGDGIFTPAMSVSGVSTSLGQDAVVGITIVILVILFSMQRFGTDKVGFSFAPIILVWFLLIGGTGLYNVFKHDIGVLRAFNPKYIVEYFQRNGKHGWISLGGIFLCISGCEAMFADLGHFNVRAIQALNLGCFPSVKVVHTSPKHEGQVYIPELNYMFMIACIAVSVAFRTSEQLAHAYGIAIVCDMTITTFLVSFVMLVVWKKSIWLVSLFFVPFGCIELVYLSAQLTKFTEGGFLPLVTAFFITMVMGTWYYAQKERYMFELKNKVSTEYVRKLANDINIKRVPGIGFLYSELVQGIPPIFPHFIDNIPCIHSVVVFVSIKAIPISTVALEERFLFRQVEPREYRIFRCVVRHGYRDVVGDPLEFESQLLQQLKEFIRQESLMLGVEGPTTEQVPISTNESDEIPDQGSIQTLGVETEIKFIDKAMDQKGVVYLLGETEVVADPKSSIFNKIVVNYGYSFLRRNFRQRDKLMAIPRKRLVKVGMTYEI
ncbi:Potassium transporter [Sesbania bispinosa]|nr:Potassium transporter [Sesbania bispinosa]